MTGFGFAVMVREAIVFNVTHPEAQGILRPEPDHTGPCVVTG